VAQSIRPARFSPDAASALGGIHIHRSSVVRPASAGAGAPLSGTLPTPTDAVDPTHATRSSFDADGGTTATRHREFGANTPWYRTSGNLGGGTKALKRAMNSIGSMIRWVSPRPPGTFSSQATRPSASSLTRPDATVGLAT